MVFVCRNRPGRIMLPGNQLMCGKAVGKSDQYIAALSIMLPGHRQISASFEQSHNKALQKNNFPLAISYSTHIMRQIKSLITASPEIALFFLFIIIISFHCGRLGNNAKLKLHIVEFAVEPVVTHELAMRAAFGNNTFIDQHNFIGITDGGESMRNHE